MKGLKPCFWLSVLGGLAGLAGGYLVINHAFYLIPDPAKKLIAKADLLENVEARRCSECHKLIFESWKKSRHSQAWISENYIKDSENRTKEKCLNCHIPQEVRAGVKPDPRSWARDDGIYCIPCHVLDKQMNGPYDLYAPPHPTRQNADYRKSKICGSCHQKTFKEWTATGNEKTCQECHMPHVEGRLTQKFPLSLLHSPKSVGDHSFPHGEITADSLAVSARIENGSLLVTLLNKSIPHLVPTAENGDPRLFLSVLFYDASGNEVDKYKEILAPQQETALPFGVKKEFQYPLGNNPIQRVEVLLKYQPAWSKDKQDVRSLSLEIGKTRQ